MPPSSPQVERGCDWFDFTDRTLVLVSNGDVKAVASRKKGRPERVPPPLGSAPPVIDVGAWKAEVGILAVSGIKSRPVYPGLTPDLNARCNMIVCDPAGAEAVIELLARADGAFAGRTNIILVADRSGAEAIRALEQRLRPASVEVVTDLNAAIARLVSVLATASMGLRLYAAGSEPLIGSVVQAGLEHFIDHLSIRTEHRGSLMRRVQCVHCKGMTENVTTNPVTCAQCGLLLLVRDHYSRRLAAFQGVCINAEDPHERPEPKVEFQ